MVAFAFARSRFISCWADAFILQKRKNMMDIFFIIVIKILLLLRVFAHRFKKIYTDKRK